MIHFQPEMSRLINIYLTNCLVQNGKKSWGHDGTPGKHSEGDWRGPGWIHNQPLTLQLVSCLWASEKSQLDPNVKKQTEILGASACRTANSATSHRSWHWFWCAVNFLIPRFPWISTLRVGQVNAFSSFSKFCGNRRPQVCEVREAREAQKGRQAWRGLVSKFNSGDTLFT